MERCERLRKARKALGMNQREFGKLVGLGHATIFKLEKDPTHWSVMKAASVDKIAAFYDLYETGQLTGQNHKIGKVDDKPCVIANEPKPVVDVEAKVVSSGLTQLDQKTLTLIEFTYESLNEAKTHAEIVANISLLKRILAKY